MRRSLLRSLLRCSVFQPATIMPMLVWCRCAQVDPLLEQTGCAKPYTVLEVRRFAVQAAAVALAGQRPLAAAAVAEMH